jgi:hypothetical protein
MTGTRLTGLEGTNPLGFLAALGLQVAFASHSRRPRLWWSDDITPRALVDTDFSVDELVDQALSACRAWSGSPVLTPVNPEGVALKKGEQLKLARSDIRVYLQLGRNGGPGATLPAALVAEGSLDGQKKAKPSDFYFAAGQQKLLKMAREILKGVTHEDLANGLLGPWPYTSELPSLMWDVADDRVYALRGYDPTSSGEEKLSNPGPEALAILGVSLHPVFAGRERTLTQGCSGGWKNGWYSWPLWRRPASPFVVRSLLAHAYDDGSDSDREDRQKWFRSWGVVTVLRSPIRRSSQGGYGTFGPPEVAWRDRHTGGVSGVK